MSKLKIGIVGCGAIGTSLAKAIMTDFSKSASLSALYDINIGRAQRISKKLTVTTLSRLINKSDLVIEAASARSSLEIAESVLLKGRSVMVMSVGGLLGHIKRLSLLARKHHARVYVPSGAICGVDGLKAASMAKIKKVTLTTYKNPMSFKGVKYVEDKGVRLDKIKQDKVLFYGKAKEAVKYFPQNINVAAVLSIAGIGQDRTYVKIIASPKTKKNIHEVRVESSAGNIATRTENILHPDNPKTSFLAVLAALGVLRRIMNPVIIGT